MLARDIAEVLTFRPAPAGGSELAGIPNYSGGFEMIHCRGPLYCVRSWFHPFHIYNQSISVSWHQYSHQTLFTCTATRDTPPAGCTRLRAPDTVMYFCASTMFRTVLEAFCFWAARACMRAWSYAESSLTRCLIHVYKTACGKFTKFTIVTMDVDPYSMPPPGPVPRQ